MDLPFSGILCSVDWWFVTDFKGQTVSKPFATSAPDGGEWLALRSGHFIFGKDLIPTVQEAG